MLWRNNRKLNLRTFQRIVSYILFTALTIIIITVQVCSMDSCLVTYIQPLAGSMFFSSECRMTRYLKNTLIEFILFYLFCCFISFCKIITVIEEATQYQCRKTMNLFVIMSHLYTLKPVCFFLVYAYAYD